MYNFQQKLKFIKYELRLSNKNSFGDIIAEKNLIALKMEALQQNIISNGMTEQRKKEELNI